MRVSVDRCGILTVDLLCKDGFSLKYGIYFREILLVDTITSQENHVRNRFDSAMSVAWVVKICVPIDLVFS